MALTLVKMTPAYYVCDGSRYHGAVEIITVWWCQHTHTRKNKHIHICICNHRCSWKQILIYMYLDKFGNLQPYSIVNSPVLQRNDLLVVKTLQVWKYNAICKLPTLPDIYRNRKRPLWTFLVEDMVILQSRRLTMIVLLRLRDRIFFSNHITHK